MRQSITRKRSKLPTCEQCGGPLETAATAHNPSATIAANSLARCPSCLILFVIGADLQPSPDLSCDEAAFTAAMNADPKIKKWAEKTLETFRIRQAAEIKAECVAARAWLIGLGGSNLKDDLAALDAYVAGFDEKGFTRVPDAVRRRASNLLHQLSWGTRH
jgi:hypothetical protein